MARPDSVDEIRNRLESDDMPSRADAFQETIEVETAMYADIDRKVAWPQEASISIGKYGFIVRDSSADMKPGAGIRRL
jgi:hypothetical protein